MRPGTALCSWTRHLALTVPLFTQVYKWVPANLMLGVALWWTSIPGIQRGPPGSRNTPSRFMIQNRNNGRTGEGGGGGFSFRRNFFPLIAYAWIFFFGGGGWNLLHEFFLLVDRGVRSAFRLHLYYFLDFFTMFNNIHVYGMQYKSFMQFFPFFN